MIRKAFIPSHDYLVTFDYSQIELRILAHLAGVQSLIEAFNQDKDIHTHTAALVFKVKDEEVTANMRRQAKAVNFGIIYGMGEFKLSQQIGVSLKEAKEFIRRYFEEYPEYNNVAMGGYSSGYYKVLNSNYNVIDTVGISKSDNLNIGTEYAEQHEFIMIAPGHYISTAYIIRNPNSSHCKGTLTPGTRVLAAYLQEVKNGAVIWEWISTDYPEFYDGYVESNNYENVDYMHSIDYFHLNSVFIDPSDNNIIMSARNQNAIIKIDRSDGHIIWILGGVNDQFGLSEEQKFSRQHFATYVENGNLLLFDNGFDKEISRVVELTLDESEKLVKDYTEYGLGIFGQYCGSVQKLSYDQAIYCIGWGYKLGSYALMSLVDFNNGQVLSELIGQSNELQSYRICFYP